MPPLTNGETYQLPLSPSVPISAIEAMRPPGIHRSWQGPTKSLVIVNSRSPNDWTTGRLAHSFIGLQHRKIVNQGYKQRASSRKAFLSLALLGLQKRIVGVSATVFRRNVSRLNRLVCSGNDTQGKQRRGRELQ